MISFRSTKAKRREALLSCRLAFKKGYTTIKLLWLRKISSHIPLGEFTNILIKTPDWELEKSKNFSVIYFLVTFLNPATTNVTKRPLTTERKGIVKSKTQGF